MKKKTVITTEKREVWIVRRGLEKSSEGAEAGKPTESLVPKTDDDPITRAREKEDDET